MTIDELFVKPLGKVTKVFRYGLEVDHIENFMDDMILVAHGLKFQVMCVDCGNSTLWATKPILERGHKPEHLNVIGSELFLLKGVDQPLSILWKLELGDQESILAKAAKEKNPSRVLIDSVI